MSGLIFNNPSVVDMSLNNGNVNPEANNNETRAICFTFLGPISVFYSGSKLSEPDPKLADEILTTTKT